MSSEWPKWLYRKNPKTGTREGAVFNSPPANGGWMTRDEWVAARSGKKPVAPQIKPDKGEDEKLSDDVDSLPRHELIAVAERAGVQIDKRWGDDRIRAAIKEKAGI